MSLEMIHIPQQTQKNRHNTLSGLELRKFCPYCYKHTIHVEIKK